MILITFHSVSSALYLETVLKERELGCRIIPVPRELSSSCGYAAETDTDDAAALKPVMDDAGIEWECLYRKGDGFEKLECSGT